MFWRRLFGGVARGCGTLAETRARVRARPRAPAPPLKLVYDNTTTSLFLFCDICYNRQLTACGCPDTTLLDHLSYAHGNICPKQRRTHANALYWGAPWSIPAYLYDNEMEPSMTPLEPCQIRSIEAVGCISTFELGLRCRGPPAEFVIDGTLGELDAKQVLVYKESIWQNRVSTGYILLAVPTKALQYGSLDWVVNYDDFRGMPMTLSARKFVQASHDRGEDPVKELDAVDAIGIRKCVVVDLRGIGINRKMGLFFAEDALRDVLPCVAGTKLVPAKAVFDDRLWDKLGVQGRVAKDAAVCDIMHSEGITEMMLLKSQDCGGRLDKVTNSQDTMLLEPKSKTKAGECLFSTAVLAANAKYIPCSKTKCGGLTMMLCENPNCLANNVMRWATQAMFRIFLGKQIFLAFNLKCFCTFRAAFTKGPWD
ncbi:uncharacterized protein LOC9632882 [Selaginella moellendorffii]|uniref:uncharacterized protein LOC9632882 n=1 Tax=Selaginella moellendorffii TaxID=88036 RepID=UPI000D1C2742|nr:uncharacterized protein LOC9632882 [Selaginella moellendorffii]|eukprot:XP_024521175.1 uncharacterized protein LOC9632882 [Selaginella moellendorffii]